MSDRFFIESAIAGNKAVLGGSEARHLAKVMRAETGDQVVLFDGSGAEYAARILRIGRSEVELEVVQRQEVDRELPFDLTLGVAMPKGDRQRWLVEKAVELGVTRLVPLRAARGVAQPVDQALARLRRAVIEASKQSGRNRLMQVLAPQTLGHYTHSSPQPAVRWLAHPARAEEQSSLAAGQPLAQPVSRPIYLAIGPEGGFTEEEVSAAQAAGWQLVDLGPRILRVETAAVALAAVVSLNAW